MTIQRMPCRGSVYTCSVRPQRDTGLYWPNSLICRLHSELAELGAPPVARSATLMLQPGGCPAVLKFTVEAGQTIRFS